MQNKFIEWDQLVISKYNKLNHTYSSIFKMPYIVNYKRLCAPSVNGFCRKYLFTFATSIRLHKIFYLFIWFVIFVEPQQWRRPSSRLFCPGNPPLFWLKFLRGFPSLLLLCTCCRSYNAVEQKLNFRIFLNLSVIPMQIRLQ